MATSVAESYSIKFPRGCFFLEPDGARGARLDTAAFKETDGRDEENAANTAKAKGGSATSLEELVQLSLTEVNGEPVNVKIPYKDFARWNSRARQFAVACWNKINGANKEELDAFLAQIQLAE